MPDGDVLQEPPIPPAPVLPAAEVLAAGEGYIAACRSAPPRLAAAAAAWLEQIRPPEWALEWSLPYWLAESMQLSPETMRKLMLSNVIGLAYIRLQDALADGEPAAQIEPALGPLLATLLYGRWMQAYRGLCDSPRFWELFDSYMAEWLVATAGEDALAGPAFQAYEEADFLRLAHRGAPLKACAAAACLLAGREADLPALAGALDHLLVGAVLLDHAHDWPADLAAGRYNAFVAYASALPQTPEHRSANLHAVQRELWLGSTGRHYFAIASRCVEEAGRLAQPAGCAGLQQYLLWLVQQTSACGERLASSAAARLDASVRHLTGGI